MRLSPSAEPSPALSSARYQRHLSCSTSLLTQSSQPPKCASRAEIDSLLNWAFRYSSRSFSSMCLDCSGMELCQKIIADKRLPPVSFPCQSLTFRVRGPEGLGICSVVIDPIDVGEGPRTALKRGYHASMPFAKCRRI